MSLLFSAYRRERNENDRAWNEKSKVTPEAEILDLITGREISVYEDRGAGVM